VNIITPEEVVLMSHYLGLVSEITPPVRARVLDIETINKISIKNDLKNDLMTPGFTSK
jgi:hypothetical protein